MKKYILIIAAAAISVTSCNKTMGDFEKNPNRSVNVSPDLVLRGVLSDLNADRPWSMISRLNQFDCANYNYYGDQRYDWTGANLSYATLNNINKMEQEAIRTGNPALNAYGALAKLYKAILFYNMTNLVGDLPLKEALQGLGNTMPKYDSQKEIFVQINKWLEESNTDIAKLISTGSTGFDGDIYFSNNLSKWQKTVNTFRLRVLIALSKKENDADLKVASTFANIINNPKQYPIFESMADNLEYKYSSFNKYPSNPDNLGFDATRYNMAATYLNNLVAINDPRVYVVAEPATKQLSVNKKTPSDITAYVGASSGESLDDMSSKMSKLDTAEYSVRSRARYYSSYAPENGMIVGYPEMCFNIAEAINRKWITGDAEAWYKKGIKASHNFYGLETEKKSTYSKVYKGVTYTIDVDFDNVYYKQVEVMYKGNNADGLKQILTQKYFAFFQNSGREAYYNWRRTNVPQFLTGAGTGNSSTIPLRYQYPSSERTTNADNLKTALQNQYSGKDDINASMWLIK